MGPRLFSRGNRFCLRSGVTPNWRLQWGRDSSVAEIRAFQLLFTTATNASMGPRLFSRGNGTTVSGASESEVSFNGAATLQSRKLTLHLGAAPRMLLQWGRDSSVAEIVIVTPEVAAEAAASMGPRLFSRGNPSSENTGQMTKDASMGPRLFSRGNDAEKVLPDLIQLGFNGAATLQSRKLFHSFSFPRSKACFNGAATLQSRKSPHGRCTGRTAEPRRGRDSSVAEMTL